MTSNNLEAIELLRSVKFSDYETSKKIVAAIDLLQADEVKEECTNDFKCPVHNARPRPTKETKLRDLRGAFDKGEVAGANVSFRHLVNILDILLEEEY